MWPVLLHVFVCGGRFSSGFYDHVSNALDGRVFILDEFHKAYHHYIKVTTTLSALP